MLFWQWFWLAALAIFMVSVLAAAIAETERSIRIGAGRTTRIRRAGGKDALWLIPLVGGGRGRHHGRGDDGHDHGDGDGDDGGGGSGGGD